MRLKAKMNETFTERYIGPLMSQSLWYSGLRPAPLPPAQPLPLSTTGLNILCVQKFPTFSSNGGEGEQMGTLGKNGAWGDATCT